MIKTNSLSNINIGGYCEEFYTANNNKDLINYVTDCYNNNKKFKVIGSGSNIYFCENYKGTIIKNECKKIIETKYFPINYIEEVDNENIILIVSSGTLLMDVIYHYQKLENDISQLSGIPGTIGGAVYNNAGAYGLEISNILIGCTVIKDGKLCYFSNSDFEFEYRNSILKKMYSNIVIVTVFLKKYKKEKSEIINQNINKICHIRKNKLPYSEKNIGSIFKNIYLDNIKIPVGILLEKIGSKQLSYNNLQIYNKHSNIIINNGDSTVLDLEYFIELIKNKFLEEYGIELNTEIEKIN